MKRFTLLFILTVAAGVTGVASADVVLLKDGTTLSGDVKKGPGGYVVTQADGTIKMLALDDVRSIELASAPPLTTKSAKEKLASFRRSVEYLDDVNKIIERYQRFIEQNAGTVMEPDARQDLAMWQQRRDQGLVKFGSRWVKPDERAKLQESALQQADAARRALKAGKFAEAESLINQAIAEDAQNAAAHYLRGLLHYRQDHLMPARRSFETVVALVPNHAPTLNNLAVILSKQNQHATSLNTYDQAMIIAPKNRDVLNNVAEAVYSMPDNVRGTPVAQRVLRRFTEQDEDLAGELEKQGLHRWGATWVTTEQLGQLKQAEREAKDKLDQLSSEFDAVKVRISNIERDIEDNERAMRRLETSAYVRDINGQIWQSALPPLYGELQEDNRKLQTERQQQFIRLDKLREQARAVNRNLPVPKYSGIQRMMDETHAPVIGPAVAPTTAPTQPVG
jgi:tetratricopeptide (TPR) repeat protein